MSKFEYPPEAIPGLVLDAAKSIRQEGNRLGGKPLDARNKKFAEMIRHYCTLWGMTEQSAPSLATIQGILKTDEEQAE